MDRTDPACPRSLRNTPQGRSVVLIDEIDKAPRDLTNDILFELERMAFQVKETQTTFVANQSYQPILLMTSNLEKDLPDAFRRRCIFYHIAFPEKPRLLEIIKKRLDLPAFTEEMLGNAVDLFLSIRNERNLSKLPATAELIAWINLLDRLGLDVKDGIHLDAQRKAALACSYSLLAKSVEDFATLRDSVA